MENSVFEEIKNNSQKIIRKLDNINFDDIDSKELVNISEVLKNLYIISEKDTFYKMLSADIMNPNPFNCESSLTY